MLHKLFVLVLLVGSITAAVMLSIPFLLSQPDTFANIVGVFGFLCYLYLVVFALPKLWRWVFKVKADVPS